MGRRAEFGIIINAEDQTGGATDSAAKGTRALAIQTEDLRKNVSALPEKLSKTAGAMTLAAGAAGQMGGSVGSAAVRVADMAAMVAGGGVLGIALAAATAAIAAFSFAWQVFTRESEEARAEINALNSVLRDSADALLEETKKTQDLQKALENWGLTSQQIRVQELEGRIAIGEEVIGTFDRELDAIDRQIRSLNVLQDEERESLGLQRERILELRRQAIASQENRQEQSRALQALEDRKFIEEEELARAQRIKQSRDRRIAAIRKERDEIQALRDRVEDFGKTSEQAAADRLQAQIDLLALNDNLTESESRQIAKLREKLDLNRQLIELSKKQKEDQEAAAEAAKQRQEAIRANEKAAADFAAAEERARQQSMDAAQATADEWQGAAMRIGEDMGTAVADVSSGAQTMEQAMGNAAISALKTIIQTVISSVTAHAINAGAGAASSQAGIPIVGPALAAGAMAAVTGLVMGLLSQIPKAEEGGFVRGGIPGVDSVPILAQQGELVIPRGGVEQLLSDQKAPSVTIINRTWMPSIVDEMRMSRRQQRSRKRLSKQRMLPVGA